MTPHVDNNSAESLRRHLSVVIGCSWTSFPWKHSTTQRCVFLIMCRGSCLTGLPSTPGLDCPYRINKVSWTWIYKHRARYQDDLFDNLRQPQPRLYWLIILQQALSCLRSEQTSRFSSTGKIMYQGAVVVLYIYHLYIYIHRPEAARAVTKETENKCKNNLWSCGGSRVDKENMYCAIWPKNVKFY